MGSEHLVQYQFKAGNSVSQKPARAVKPTAILARILAGLGGEAEDDDPCRSIDSIERFLANSGPKHPLRVMMMREVLTACRPRERTAIDRHGVAYPAGTDPEPGRALERIIDRLEGKPTARLEVQRVSGRAPADIIASIADLIRTDPALAALVKVRMDGGLEVGLVAKTPILASDVVPMGTGEVVDGGSEDGAAVDDQPDIDAGRGDTDGSDTGGAASDSAGADDSGQFSADDELDAGGVHSDCSRSP